MRGLTQDVRYAWRQLRRTPGFTATAVLTLALGIGTNTAFFAMADAMAFRPYRTADLKNISVVWHVDPRTRAYYPVSTISTFRDLDARRPPGVTGVAASEVWGPVTARAEDNAERVVVEFVTGEYAGLLALHAETGRFIAPGDDRSGAVAVVSDRLWRAWFGSRRAVVGRTTIRIGNTPFAVIGVAPRGFRGALSTSVDVWLPMRAAQTVRPDPSPGHRTINQRTLVRTAPGASVGQVEATIAQTLGDGPDGSFAGWPVRLEPAGPYTRGVVTSIALTALALSALVLLAACANLANLLYARGADRAGEMAIRLSLGASRTQLFRLLLAETAIISTLAAAGGLALALGATHLYGTAFPTLWGITLDLDLMPDWRVFLYACAAGALAALLVGVATAWRSSRVPLARTLASCGAASSVTKRARRRQTALVAIQVTAAVVLVIGAGLFLQGVWASLDRRLTFDTSHLASARIDLKEHGYNDSRGLAFFEHLLHDVGRLPGVERAALAAGIPGGAYAGANGGPIFADKESSPAAARETGWIDGSYRQVMGSFTGVSPGFLDTIGLPLEHGRDFTPNDRAGAPLVAIVSNAVASRLWPAQDAIGKRLMFGNDGYWRTVVGVSADPGVVSERSSSFDLPRLVLVPHEQHYGAEMLIIVRSATPAAVSGPLRDAIRALDDNVAAFDNSTVDASILAWVNPMRASMALVVSLGFLALGMATLGVYGVVAYSVRTRTREFGIRLALGATPRRVNRMIFDEAVHVMLVGLLPGVFVASVLSRFVESSAFGIMPNNIPTWIAVPLIILITGVAAAYLPARRAGRVDPNVALRDL